jgi:hypothetical protein
MRLYLLAKSLGYDSVTLVEAARAAGVTDIGSALHNLTADQLDRLRTFVVEQPEKMNAIQATILRQKKEEQERVGRPVDSPTIRRETRPAVGVVASISRDESDAAEVARFASNLIHAVASDMFKGFEHFAVVELGALFETLLSRMDPELDGSGLAESIRRNCEAGTVTRALKRHLLLANRTRNRIVHRRPDRFPAASEIAEAKQAFAVAVIDIYRRHRNHSTLLEPLADSNPEVLNVLDQFLGLDRGSLGP